MTTDTIEKCSTCGGPMIVEDIYGDGHDSWVCNKDGTAWAVDQEWANSALEDEA